MIALQKNAVCFFCVLCFLLLCSGNIAAQDTDTRASKKITKTLYGTASFYNNKFNGRKTANGQVFSQEKFTCACNVLPLGTWLKVTNVRNGKSVIVKVTDRLHPRMNRLVDLSRSAAQKLGFIAWGITRVKAEVQFKRQ